MVRGASRAGVNIAHISLPSAEWSAIRNKPAQIFIASLAALSLIGLAVPALAAPPKPKKYANCAAMTKVYRHGVARNGGRDKVTAKGKPVTTFTVYTATYTLNKALDRDKDGIACEKR